MTSCSPQVTEQEVRISRDGPVVPKSLSSTRGPGTEILVPGRAQKRLHRPGCLKGEADRSLRHTRGTEDDRLNRHRLDMGTAFNSAPIAVIFFTFGEAAPGWAAAALAVLFIASGLCLPSAGACRQRSLSASFLAAITEAGVVDPSEPWPYSPETLTLGQ